MRIVLDLRSVHPEMTGIGRYASNLALSLETVAQREEIILLSSERGADFLRPSTNSELQIVDRPSAKWDEFALPDLLHELSADVYHTPLFVLPSIRACRQVCTVHDVIPLARPDLCPASFLEFFHQEAPRGLARADQIVTVSKSSRNDLIRLMGVPETQISTIPEPVSPCFAPVPDAEFLLRQAGVPIGSTGYLLYVGAIDRRKNLLFLLDAYRVLTAQDGVRLPLLIAGGSSGDGLDIGSEIGRRDLGANVRVLGRVPDTLLPALYSAATAFLFPSLYEGFGLPVLEAMACGTPVITSRTSSLPEVAGDSAILVDPNDVNSIREGTLRMIRNPELRRSLKATGLERAREFRPEVQGRLLLSLYREVMEPAA